MKTCRVLLAVLTVFCIGACVCGFAQEHKEKQEKRSPVEIEKVAVRGRILLIDAAAGKIVIEAKDGTKTTYAIDLKVLEKLKPGQWVRLEVIEGADMVVSAERIRSRRHRRRSGDSE